MIIHTLVVSKKFEVELVEKNQARYAEHQNQQGESTGDFNLERDS